MLMSQVAKIGPLRPGATRSIMFGKTLTGGTILSALSSCVKLDSLCAMTFSHLECVRLESPVFWNTRSGFSIEGHKEGLTSPTPPHPPPLLHTGNHCCVVCSYDSNIVQPHVLEFLKGQMTTLVPDSSMCNLLLEGTMVPLAVCSPK